jgi:diacylglycerol O-acyltransferase
MILTETAETPIQLSALLTLDVSDRDRNAVFDRLRAHLVERLANTPLLAALRQAPDGYDSDVWVDVAGCDTDSHVERVGDPLNDCELDNIAAVNSMRRLDLARAPFRVIVFDDVGPSANAPRRCAVQITVHHCVTDGVGLQNLLARLTDDAPPASGVRVAGEPLPDDQWLAAAAARFEAEAPAREAKRALMEQARDALRNTERTPRAHTPVLKMSGPTSRERAYTRVRLPLDRVRTVAHSHDSTINDILLALAAAAVRGSLIDLGDLPESPIVVNSARSYRRPEHGEFGNRIVALHPHLATHIDDPLERLGAIRASMADERDRTQWDEAMLDQLEVPYGPRDRRAKYAERARRGAPALPGNVTVSNVPGPAEPRRFAGWRQLSNHPVPLLGNGRFLNITSRRNGDWLDLGVMADPTKLPDVQSSAALMQDALGTYESLATTRQRTVR